MGRDFVRQARKGNRMWWITAFAVLGFFLCIGTALYLKYFLPARTNSLPEVPTFGFSTSTLASPSNSFPDRTPVPTGTFVLSTSQSTATVTPTQTSFSFYNWILSGGATQTRTPVTVQYVSPTSSRVVVSVASVTPTNTPTNIPLPSPPPPLSPNPSTCKNILYPARPGSQWMYYVNSPKRSGNINMSVISIDGQQATVDALDLNNGATARTYVQCDQDIILNFPLLSAQKLIGNMINGTMNMDYIGGVLAPNEAAFTSSNWALSWIIQYRIYGSGIINFRGRDFNIDIAPSTVQMTCQTLGSGTAAFETVTVPAGTFNALKVVCRGDGQVTATVNGSQVTGSVTAQATQWFAPNVGLLRSQSDYAYLNVFGISLPLNPSDISGYLELQSYAIGQ